MWLLQQFLEALKGKASISVITDVDLAMKNATSRVFPHAHHRLCAWRLLRNAMSNVGIPGFILYLKKCMLGDIDKLKFEEIWNEMVSKFGLQNNNWLMDLYERRKMWSITYIRGNFFVGIRTTLRCEALHSHIGQFVNSRITLWTLLCNFTGVLPIFDLGNLKLIFNQIMDNQYCRHTYDPLRGQYLDSSQKRYLIYFSLLLRLHHL